MTAPTPETPAYRNAAALVPLARYRNKVRPDDGWAADYVQHVPPLLAEYAGVYADGREAGRGDMEALERRWRAEERRDAESAEVCRLLGAALGHAPDGWGDHTAVTLARAAAERLGATALPHDEATWTALTEAIAGALPVPLTGEDADRIARTVLPLLVGAAQEARQQALWEAAQTEGMQR